MKPAFSIAPSGPGASGTATEVIKASESTDSFSVTPSGSQTSLKPSVKSPNASTTTIKPQTLLISSLSGQNTSNYKVTTPINQTFLSSLSSFQTLTPPNTALLFSNLPSKSHPNLASPSNRFSIAPSLAARNSLLSQYSPTIERATEVSVFNTTSDPVHLDPTIEENPITLGSVNSSPAIPSGYIDHSGNYSQSAVPGISFSSNEPATSFPPHKEFSLEEVRENTSKLASILVDMRNLRQSSCSRSRSNTYTNPMGSFTFSNQADIDQEPTSLPKSKSLPAPMIQSHLKASESQTTDSDTEHGENSFSERDTANLDIKDTRPTIVASIISSIAPPESIDNVSKDSASAPVIEAWPIDTPKLASKSINFSSTSSNPPRLSIPGHYRDPETGTIVSGIHASVLNKDLPALPVDQTPPSGGWNSMSDPNINNNRLSGVVPKTRNSRAYVRHSTGAIGSADNSTGLTIIPVSGPNLTVPQYPLPPPPPKPETYQQKHSRSHSLPVKFADLENEQDVSVDDQNVDENNDEDEDDEEAKFNQGLTDDSQNSSSGSTRNEAPTPSSAILNPDIGMSSSGSSSNTPGSGSSAPTYSSTEGTPNVLMRVSSGDSSIDHPASIILPRSNSAYSSASLHDYMPLSNPKSRPGTATTTSGDSERNLSPTVSYITAPSSPQKYNAPKELGSPKPFAHQPKSYNIPQLLSFARSNTRSVSDGHVSPTESFNTAHSRSSAPNTPDLHKQLQQPKSALGRINSKSDGNIIFNNSGIGIGLTGVQTSPNMSRPLFHSNNTVVPDLNILSGSETEERLGPALEISNFTFSQPTTYPASLTNASMPFSTAVGTPVALTVASSSRASINTSAPSVSDRSTIKQKNSYPQIYSNVSSTSSAKNGSSVLTVSADHLGLMPEENSSSSLLDDDAVSALSKPSITDLHPGIILRRKHNNSSPLLSFVPSVLEKNSIETFDINSTDPANTSESDDITQTTQLPKDSLTSQSSRSQKTDSIPNKISSSQSAPLLSVSTLGGTELVSQEAPGKRNSLPYDVSQSDKESKGDTLESHHPLHTRDFRTSAGPETFPASALAQLGQQSPLSQTFNNESHSMLSANSPNLQSTATAPHAESDKPQRTSLENVTLRSHGRSASDLSRNNARRGRRDRNSGASFKSEKSLKSRASEAPQHHAPPLPPQHTVTLEQVPPSQKRPSSVSSASQAYFKPIEQDDYNSRAIPSSSSKSANTFLDKDLSRNAGDRYEYPVYEQSSHPTAGSQWTTRDTPETESEVFENDDIYKSHTGPEDNKNDEAKGYENDTQARRRKNKAQYIDDHEYMMYEHLKNGGSTRPLGRRVVSGGSILTTPSISSASSSLQHIPRTPYRGLHSHNSRSSRVASLSAIPPATPEHRSTATPMAAAAMAANAAANAAALAATMIAETLEASNYEYYSSSRQSSGANSYKTTHLKRGPSEKFKKFSKQFAETFHDDLDADYEDIPEHDAYSSWRRRTSNGHYSYEHSTGQRDTYNRSVTPRQSKPFTQSSIQHLMDLSDATFCLDQIDIPPTERRLIEKFVDALAKLSTDISADSNKRREGVRRLHNALRAIEGWI